MDNPAPPGVKRELQLCVLKSQLEANVLRSVLLTNPLKTEKAAAPSNRSDRSRSTGRDRRFFFCSAAI